nr:hypothetical protein [Anaerococcus degeneri]
MGQAPGKKVEKTGLLFDDRSGDNLVDRQVVFIRLFFIFLIFK